MYSTRYVNKNKVDGNAYLAIGDPYKDPTANAFRQPKKGEKLTPFMMKVTLSTTHSIDIYSFIEA